jgi:hypothetical protein
LCGNVFLVEIGSGIISSSIGLRMLLAEISNGIVILWLSVMMARLMLLVLLLYINGGDVRGWFGVRIVCTGLFAMPDEVFEILNRAHDVQTSFIFLF